MKKIIPPIPAETLKKELTEDKFMRDTNFGGNKIYSVDYKNSPEIMQEIGRLRELTFRNASGGTGKEVDIDEFDTAQVPYKQLIVWDPEKEAILGGYRYVFCEDTKDENGEYHLATTELFHFSDTFKKEYSPHVLELGRSFVHPDYQSGKARRKGMFALDNLWDGLGALVTENKNIKYLYGKVTMYQSYDQLARDYILYFMDKHFGDKEQLIYPKEPLSYHHDKTLIGSVFTADNYKEDYKSLSANVRSRGVNIPPLINSYMNLSPTMKSFGTALNKEFGNVEETGIMVTIGDIYEEKKERHIKSYLEFKKRLGL